MTNDSRFPPDDQVPPPNDLRFKFVLSDDQVIYAVKPTGELLWYQYDPDLNIWDPNSGKQIGYEGVRGIEWGQASILDRLTPV